MVKLDDGRIVRRHMDHISFREPSTHSESTDEDDEEITGADVSSHTDSPTDPKTNQDRPSNVGLRRSICIVTPPDQFM